MKFPIEVNSIDIGGKALIENYSMVGISTGKLVKVYPHSDEYNCKGFIGFFLGEISIATNAIHDKDDGSLMFFHSRNPAIFIPKIGKIIYDCECHWTEIKKDDEIFEIANSIEERSWYVELLNNREQNND